MKIAMKDMEEPSWGVDKHQLGLPGGQSDADAAGNKEHQKNSENGPQDDDKEQFDH
jgi:hypothetical protein